ncbi:MAG: WS/DGAT domain-containing protein [Sandaracinaceae bacterium]|nr:WS/DGAT domain-containing protein [Sandaracinaceae bacterium]
MTAGALRAHLGPRADRPARGLHARRRRRGALRARQPPLERARAPPVEERDAWARLARASASASAAKALHAARGTDLLVRWSEVLPAASLRALWRLVRLSGRAPVDLVVSNVPGPRRPLSIGGAALKRIYSVGPLLETTGLNVTCWSYAGRLYACVLACGDHDCDPEAIARGLERALEELLARVSPRAARGGLMRRRQRRRAKSMASRYQPSWRSAPAASTTT